MSLNNRPRKGYAIKHFSRPKPINASDAKGIANREISLRTFNPDYDMIVKRASKSATNGLRCGSPPGIVT